MTKILSSKYSVLLITAIYASQHLVPCLAVDIPPPTGRYGVGVREYAIPFLHTNNLAWPGNTSTSYLATIYYPTLDSPNEQSTPYADFESATRVGDYFDQRSGLLTSFTTNLIPNASIAKPSSDKPFPSLLFQPGLAATSFMYTILLSELASRGYAVAALDFPYEAAFARYPNGTGIASTVTNETLNGVEWTLDMLYTLYDVRVDTGRHFLEQWPGMVEELDAPFQTASLGVLGHSLGGASSVGVAAAVPDTKLVASALNLDGALFGAPASDDPSVADIKRPVVLLGQTIHTGDLDTTWVTFPAAQTGWWRILFVAGANHTDFTDQVFWRKLQEDDGQPGDTAIEPLRMVDVTREFVTTFFNYTLLNQDGVILSEPGACWPEVTVHAEGNGTLSS